MNDVWVQSLRRHLEAGHLSRRDFAKRAAALGLSVPAISAILAACGGDDDKDTGSDTTPASGGAQATATEANITVNQNVTATTGTSNEGTPETAASPTEAEPTGKSGGSVIFARAVDAENMDPVTQDGNINIWPLMSIYDQLIRVDDQGTGLIPGLATEWSVSDDSLTYTFNIREGVLYSDGSPLTVEDIKWSIERARDTEDSPWTFTLEQVSDIQTPDDKTVVMKLNKPWSPFLSDVSMFNASIISKPFADKVGVEGLVDQCMGTGPFSLKEWKKAESMTLAKNENYWEEGMPLVDTITLKIVPDVNSEILQFQGGEVDGIIGQNDIPFNRIKDLEADSNLQVLKFPSTYNNFMVLQTQHEPLDDVHVRKAMNYATDKQAIIDTVLFGVAEISNSFMPNGSLFWNPDQEGYPFDLDKAKEEMAQSKVPDGFKVSFNIRSGNDQQQQVATIVKDMWSKINIEVDINPLEATVDSQAYRDENFSIRLSGWTNDIIDPDEIVSYAILPESTNNYHTGWQDPKAIDLANQARAEQDPEKRREIYKQIQQIHMDAAPFVYLYVIPYVDAVNKKIKGFFHHPMGQWDFRKMSVE
jgi:peptide/nickel transport system substrate-binding protein